MIGSISLTHFEAKCYKPKLQIGLTLTYAHKKKGSQLAALLYRDN
jgi:hypothetical protein